MSINIVLVHVVSFPTNLVSSNSESVCKSCGSFGFLSRAAAVLPRPVFYFRPEQYYDSTTAATFAPDQNLMLSPAEVGTNVFFLVPLTSSSTATLSGSTVRASGSTAPTILLAFCLFSVVFQRAATTLAVVPLY
jgi:hypothetical protein